MAENYDKRHLDQLISDEQLEIDKLLEEGLGKEFADADLEKRTQIAQRLKYSRRFDYALYADGENAKAAVEKLAESIETHRGKKLSAPSRRQLNCLLANLYRFHQRNENIWISVSMRNGKAVPKKYNPSGVSSKTLRLLVVAMKQMELAFHVLGKFDRDKGRKSHSPRIGAEKKLISILENEFGWKPTNIKYHPLDTLVILNSEKDENGNRHHIDYEQTAETDEIETFLRNYNRYLSDQEVMLSDDWKAFPDMIQMRRTFTDASWEKGGRLYGGEYQQLSKQHRKDIQINGCATIEVDIKSCHPTMAFAAAGIDWYRKHNREIYDLGTNKWPRDIIKRAFNIMLNSNSQKQAILALRNLSTDDLATDEGYFVEYTGWAKELVHLVEGTYPELADIFYGDCGNTFMKMEGDICSQVIQKFMDMDIPVLTIHDSFICPEQHKETVSKLVYEAFTDIVGVSCVVE
ncbi:hypothetical protein N9N21_07010 [Alphaproteobacteria bacterium]|nr:hypothetical protein [Alphaproteobacteria bacterium]